MKREVAISKFDYCHNGCQYYDRANFDYHKNVI